MEESIFLKDNYEFVLFGYQHFLAILFFSIIGFSLIKYASKSSFDLQIKIGNYIAYFVSASVIIWTIYKLISGNFDISNDLPFQLCYFLGLIMPLFTRSRKQLYYDILLFWVFAGTFQAILTPGAKNGFPHIHYIYFWIVHCGLLITMLYATFIYKMRPKLKSVFISFIAIQGYFIFVSIINTLTGANYFYLNAKPNAPSLLDFLGEWPYYILMAELILIPYFLIIYLPFYLTRVK
ncbi:YwaF family protein [Lutibacter sp.]